MLKDEICKLLMKDHKEDIERERRKLAYFEDWEVLYFKQEVIEALKKAKSEKIVDLFRVKRLLLSLLAIEQRMKESSGGTK
jgi:hypothetical protein